MSIDVKVRQIMVKYCISLTDTGGPLDDASVRNMIQIRF